MKYLGIDYGAKRIGIAISDSDGGIAFPRLVIENTDQALNAIQELVTREYVQQVIIGDTRTVSGGENPITEEAQAFVSKLTATLKVPVETVWEAWSSIEAARYAPKGKEHDDSSAAAIILQRYLDGLRR